MNGELKMEKQPVSPFNGHFYASMVKSVLRLFAGYNLVVLNLPAAGLLFIFAECVGIIEEVV